LGRTVKNRRRPEPRPVQKIELSESNFKRRAIAAVLFLIIGVALLVYCFVVFLTPDSGWTFIEANRTENDSNELVFQYNLGVNGKSSADENRALTAIYNTASEKIFRLFHDKKGFDNLINIYEINRRPNEELEIDEALYNALSIFKKYDSRYLYLAPVYSRYDDLFYCLDDSQIVDFDPLTSDDVKKEYAITASYANNPEAIDIELLGDNKIKLFVSEEYLRFAQEEAITDFIGLSWLKNAFVVDYLADVFISEGYTSGSISSYDGFIRNLDGSGLEYSFNIFDKMEGNVYHAAVMQYNNAMSIVYLRNYTLNSLDDNHYYRLNNGEVRTPYLDVKDGIPKSSLNNLVSYSESKGCAEILMEMIPVYISEMFNEQTIGELSESSIYSVYCKDSTIRYNDKDLVLSALYDRNGIKYNAEIF